MDRRERYPEPEEALRIALDSLRAQMWTALPAIVTAFDSARMTCEAQPTITGTVRKPDGTFTTLQMPKLLDCPVVFPGGGGAVLTFPLTPGDEVLVVFSSRCIDGWWDQGGVQGQVLPRMHDLSDGFVIPQVRSKPRALSVNPVAVELRSDDGATFIRLDPASGRVDIVGDLHINGTRYVEHTHGGTQPGAGSTAGVNP